MSEQSLPAPVLAALDPDNDAMVRAMSSHMQTRRWTHGTLPTTVIRELIAIQRFVAGLGPEPPGLDRFGFPRSAAPIARDLQAGHQFAPPLRVTLFRRAWAERAVVARLTE